MGRYDRCSSLYTAVWRHFLHCKPRGVQSDILRTCHAAVDDIRPLLTRALRSMLPKFTDRSTHEMQGTRAYTGDGVWTCTTLREAPIASKEAPITHRWQKQDDVAKAFTPGVKPLKCSSSSSGELKPPKKGFGFILPSWIYGNIGMYRVSDLKFRVHLVPKVRFEIRAVPLKIPPPATRDAIWATVPTVSLPEPQRLWT